MHRCFVSPETWDVSDLRPAPDENHHLLRVLRLGDGDRVGVFDGCGREAVAEIAVQSGSEVVLKVVSEVSTAPAEARIVLVQAVPKGRRMDLVIEKATELGVSSVWPIVTERVVVRLDESKRRDRVERWRRIARNAARQCGLARIPDVLPVCGYGDAVTRCSSFDIVLLGSLSPDASPIRSVIEKAKTRISDEGRVALLIGPEGDLTSDEIRLAEERGAVQVNLGTRVLRTETAALYGLSVLAYEFL